MAATLDHTRKSVRDGLRPSTETPRAPNDNINVELGSLTRAADTSKLGDLFMPPGAIVFRGAYKKYGVSGPNVLRGVDMTVPKGQIYGLLGPSGCGKTTLLKAIVGRLALDNGSLLVFGKQVGTQECQIPGPLVGYMPQDIVLYTELTIVEIWQYYGRLQGLTWKQIKQQASFLLDFLQLPSLNHLISQLSGGQQRRVSFATALLHDPKLLVVDEPTVGVDPILRKNIWEHLLSLTKNRGTTVVITTHYIEEARGTQTVGLMLDGRLLAEDPPEKLIQKYNGLNLEDVFFKLCLSARESVPDEQHKRSDSISSSQAKFRRTDTVKALLKTNDQDTVIGVEQSDEAPQKSDYIKKCIRRLPHQVMAALKLPSLTRLSAVILKNLIRTCRRPGLVLFSLLLPAVTISAFCSTIGQPIKEVSLAILNSDSGEFGHDFLKFIDSHFIKKVFVSSYEEGHQMSLIAKTHGILHIMPNFTDNLHNRLIQGFFAKDDIINGSGIEVALDMTAPPISQQIQYSLLLSFQRFTEDAVSKMGINPKAVDIPLRFTEPIYGRNDQPYNDYVAPGTMAFTIYFMAMSLTAMNLVVERKYGHTERDYTTGLTPLELTLGSLIVNGLIMILQVATIVVTAIFVFGVSCEGSMLLVIGLMLLQGICGMTFGLVVSSLCHDETTAIFLALGSFLPSQILCGAIWPLESLPGLIREVIIIVIPNTLSLEAVRAIMAKAWGITHYVVLLGYGSSVIWSVLFITAASIFYRLPE